jgi:dTDP-glucose pyrophosphorylase
MSARPPYTVLGCDTLRDALLALERGAVGIALALDGDGRLVGTLTDGDIRRALLAGVPLDASLAPHMQRNFTAVGPETSRAEVLDLMQARIIEQIPILDARGRLHGLHVIHQLLGAIDRPNWAVIMAGGLGTRLRPLTEHLPKPMLKVAGRPILERLVLHLVGFGIKRIFLAVHYLAQMIEDHFGDGSKFGCRIEYLREQQPLGTGGALSLLPGPSADPVVVLNGDLITQVHIGEMLAAHLRGNAVATIGVRRYFHQVPFGCVEVEGTRLLRLEEKPTLERLINAGVYVLSPEAVASAPPPPFTLPALLEGYLRRGEFLQVFEIADDWLDVGEHDYLRQAREGQP